MNLAIGNLTVILKLCYEAVVGVHGGDCVINEAHYSKILTELNFILGPDNSNHIYNQMDTCFLVVYTENNRVTTEYTF